MKIKDKTLQRFNEWSKNYDKCILQAIIFNNSHSKILREINPDENTTLHILDVACGTGKFAFNIVRYSKHIIVENIDFSPKMIKMAHCKRKHPNVHFQVGNVEKLPYKNNVFDIVVCTHAFHHFQDQITSMKEINRVLKPGGRVMIIDGCTDRLTGKIIFGFFVKKVEKNVHHMMKQEMKDLMEFVGFHKIEQKIFNWLAPLLLTIGIKN